MKRQTKKSETLDIRLPHKQKQTFMSATRKNGETASEAIRTFIDDYISRAQGTEHANPVQEITMTLSRHRFKTLGTAATAACGMFLIGAMPTAAASPFEKLDKNKDGIITEGEILPGHDADIITKLDTDGSGGVSPEELEAAGNKIVIRSTDETTDEDGKTSVMKRVKVLNFSDASSVEIKDSVETRFIVKRSGDSELTEEELDALIGDAFTVTDMGDNVNVRVFINGDDIEIDADTEVTED